MISDVNKISINGSSGFVGKYLKSSLTKNGFNVASLKSVLEFKQTVDYESYLLETLKNTQTVIILGWDTRNRRLDAQIDSMLQTIELIKFCIKESIKIIFVSTFNSSNYSQSNYCRMKFEVESFLRNSEYPNFYIIRPGLLYDENMNTSSRRTHFSFLNLQINFRNPIIKVSFQSLFDFTNNQIIPILNGRVLDVTEVGGELRHLQIPLKAKSKYVAFYINSNFFLKILRWLSPIHLNFFNMYDSFVSVIEKSHGVKNQ
jgi:hypothetical protein